MQFIFPLLTLFTATPGFGAAPTLNLHVSRCPLQQGMPLAVFVSDPAPSSHPELTLQATLDGVVVPLDHPSGGLWAYAVAGIETEGAHSFVVTIFEGGTNVGSQSLGFSVNHNSANAQIPNISSVSPRVGDLVGGNKVQISGTNFLPGTIAKIGGIPAPTSFVDAQTLLAVAPGFSQVGPEDVEVDLPVLPGLFGNPNAVSRKAYYAGSSTGPGPVPVAIVANANQTALPGAAVQLDGLSSYDPSGAPLVYEWTFLTVPANSSLVIGGMLPNTARPTFIPDVPGLFVVRLVVRETGPNPVASSAELAAVEVGGATLAWHF